MSDYRITGYTDSEELKNAVQRTKDNPSTPWGSESELVIAAVRKLLADTEAEQKATEFNIERRIAQQIDELDRTVREAIRDELDHSDQSDSTESPTTTDETTPREESASTTSEEIQWADRDDGGDWR